MNNKALFISDKKYLRSEILGGVQLCTNEFKTYLTIAGYQISEFPIEPSISLIKKIKIKAGIDAYERYSIDRYLSKLVEVINTSSIRLVLFNQVDLGFWVAGLKGHISSDVKFVGLSHGNESVDYLHFITKSLKPTFFQSWKLGRLLVKEYNLFTDLLDGVIVLSENEIAIDQWLGAANIKFLPRLLRPDFIDWKANKYVAGFAGTLDHLPNRLGIERLAKALREAGFKYQMELVGGPVSIGNELAKKYDFIQYLGAVSDHELEKIVSKWSLFLNPVFWYSRGASTKLAKAINWGIPCLTTPAGRRGYALTNEAIVTSDDTPSTFADGVIRALSDNEFLEMLRLAAMENARRFPVADYSSSLGTFLNAIENKS